MAIYEAYPKKVGRPAALRAIRKALKQFSPDFLLERTRLYAATHTSDFQFIPNPSTWFGQERFNDDPATWRRESTTPTLRAPLVIRRDAFNTSMTEI